VSLGKQKAVSTAPAYRKSDDVADVFARARAFHQLGQLAEARVGYKKVLKKRPNHFAALHMLGASEHESGDSEAALRLFKRALLLDPLSAPVQCDLGIVLAALRRHDEALACFDKLITMQADFVEAHFHQGNVLLGLGRLAEAIVSFDNAIALDSQHVNALIGKGHALHLLGRFAEAITCYDKVLMVKPAHVPALVNRGAAFKDSRQADKGHGRVQSGAGH
jgi:tetratricopeptide (TPR) repeat protein